jgi:hypothetical protein
MFIYCRYKSVVVDTANEQQILYICCIAIEYIVDKDVKENRYYTAYTCKLFSLYILRYAW